MNRLIPKGLKVRSNLVCVGQTNCSHMHRLQARMGFGSDRKGSTVSRSISTPQLTVEELGLRVRVPGVRSRIELTLNADEPISSAVTASMGHMPANHLNALKRYEPFKLVLTSDDNGVLDKHVQGDGGLVLDDNKPVRSVPPGAYLWLSPLPCTVRVCATLDRVNAAGAAMVSGGTPLSYIALTFRRANQERLPSSYDVCFALARTNPRSIKWLRASRSFAGHGLVSEPDRTGLHRIEGVLVVFSTKRISESFAARRAMSSATMCGGLSVGDSKEHQMR